TLSPSHPLTPLSARPLAEQQPPPWTGGGSPVPLHVRPHPLRVPLHLSHQAAQLLDLSDALLGALQIPAQLADLDFPLLGGHLERFGVLGQRLVAGELRFQIAEAEHGVLVALEEIEQSGL